MRTATLIAVLCCLLAMAACGGSSNTCNPDPGCVYSIEVMCRPTTIQSGGTSQCTYTDNCVGKLCGLPATYYASAGSITPFGGLFTAPQTDVTLDVTISVPLGNLVGTTTIVVNP